MDKLSEQTLCKGCKWPINVRKMLSTFSHQGKTNQNYIAIHLIPVRMAIVNTEITNSGKEVEKKESCTVGGNVN